VTYRPPPSSLPGLTRQSIFFEGLLRRRMDTRVKPAYDAEYVATFCENFPIQNFKQPSALVLAPPRELGFYLFLPSTHEGRRNAERRTLVTAAAYFPDCRETEAHGNAFQRPAAATSSSLGPTLPAQARASSPSRQAFAHPSPVPPSHLRQSPVVGSGGYPGPPESVLARHSRGRRIRPAWVTPPRPSFRSVPLQ
jgi:hypothetical protein